MIRGRTRVPLAALLAMVLAGGCASSAAPSPAAPRLNLPSGLVDIGGGRRIEVYCSAAGSGAGSGAEDPIVVLDAGLGNTASVWNQVVGLVQPFATVCAYNRAGQGLSDHKPLPHGAGSAVQDLHLLLEAARLPPPYVLVGASFGGLDVQLFARRYPTEVAGVVLVDAIAPGWDDQLEALLSPAQVAERRAIPNGEDLTNEDIRASEADVGATTDPFPPVPLVVLRHGIAFPGGPDWPTRQVEALWAALQAGLADLSPKSVTLVATRSGHRIHQLQADLVADAIHAIVDPARWPPSASDAPAAFGAQAPPATLAAADGAFIFGAPDGLREAAADGSGSRLLVKGNGSLIGEPSADAGGLLVAYTRTPVAGAGGSSPATPGPAAEPRSEVWVLETSSGSDRQVAADGQFPRLSPDGRSLVYLEHGHTILINSDGTGRRDLGEAGCPVWAPDGQSLAMCTPDDNVFILRLADLQQTTIPTRKPLNNPTAWSPDGRTLAIVSFRDGDGEVYLIDVDGTNERRLTTAPGTQGADLWIPAGLIVTSSLPDAPSSDWFLVDPVTGIPRVIGWLAGVPEPIAFEAVP